MSTTFDDGDVCHNSSSHAFQDVDNENDEKSAKAPSPPLTVDSQSSDDVNSRLWDFPVELVNPIIVAAATHCMADACRLCLVCTSFRKIALPCLYRTQWLTLDRAPRFVNILAKHKLRDRRYTRKEVLGEFTPLPLSFVENFACEDLCYISEYSVIRNERIQQLCEILMRCRNLKSLLLTPEVAEALISMASSHPSSIFSNAPLEKIAISGPVLLNENSIFHGLMPYVVLSPNITQCHLLLYDIGAEYTLTFLLQRLPKLRQLALLLKLPFQMGFASRANLANICRGSSALRQLVLVFPDTLWHKNITPGPAGLLHGLRAVHPGVYFAYCPLSWSKSTPFGETKPFFSTSHHHALSFMGRGRVVERSNDIEHLWECETKGEDTIWNRAERHTAAILEGREIADA